MSQQLVARLAAAVEARDGRLPVVAQCVRRHSAEQRRRVAPILAQRIAERLRELDPRLQEP